MANTASARAEPATISDVKSLYQQLPQWFIAIFSLSYVSGYLIEFTYYGSFGILDAAGEIFKLKYIQTGIIFLLLCAIVGVYTILVLGTPRFNAPIRQAVRGGIYVPRWSIFAAAFNVFSIYLTALLTPLPHVETIAQGGGTLALVLILVAYSTTLAYLIEKRYAQSRSSIYKESSDKPSKAQIRALCRLWRTSVCLKSSTGIACLGVTVVIDGYVFGERLGALRDLFLKGGWTFFLFAICMPLLLLRIIDR